MRVTGTTPEDAQARSAVTPTGPVWPAEPQTGRQVTARPEVTASPEVIARLLAADEVVKLTRAERNARMPSPLKVASTALSILSTALLGFALYLGFVSQLHHDRAQLTAYADFRARLALATAPVGQADPDDPTKLLTPGSAIAVLEIPRLGLKEVVFEGTDPSVLTSGPGHMRSTPLPGQAGVSIIMGRSTMYGGPFSRISTLAPDDTFTVTTGQGVHTYRVLGVRRAGATQPPPLASGGGRLTLVTADGNPFVASDVVRVDADLTSDVQPRPKVMLSSRQLSASEYPMGVDRRGWLGLVAAGAGLVIAAAIAAWTRYSWGAPQTWLVALPVITALGITAADQAVRLLPNLI